MSRITVQQNNYGRWLYTAHDDLGNTLDAGNQWGTPQEARDEALDWVAAHPSAGPFSWFVDGVTRVNGAAALPLPKIDAEEEARRAGVPTPAGWKEVSEEERAARAGLVKMAGAQVDSAPDAGMSERGDDLSEYNPIMEQRRAAEAAMNG